MNPHYKELLKQFNEDGVRYLVIGAYGVMAHTEPRYTRDLDVAIAISRDNATKTFKALNTFGAQLGSLTPDDFMDEAAFYQYDTPNARIDVFFGIPVVDFELAWSRRIVAKVEGVEVPVASLEDMIEMKRGAGRPQDLHDVDKLELARKLERSGAVEKVRDLSPETDIDMDFDL